MLLLTASVAAYGEEGLVDAPTAVARDAFQARLRYGASVRSGSQTDTTNPDLSYGGTTPNDLALQGWGWFALDGHLGGFLSLQREAFALFDGSNRVTGGGLIRASVGPTGRLIFGPVKLEAAVGYAFHQLPLFASTANLTFSAAQRHGVLLAARGLVDIGPVSVEARGEVPISFLAKDGAGRAASSSGYAVGGAVRVQLIRTGSLLWGLLADVSYGSDSLTTADGLRANQSMIRAGGAVDVKWQEETVGPLPRFGDLQMRVLDFATGEPLPGARVEVGEKKWDADAAGTVKAMGLPAGTVSARATAEGYVSQEAQGTVAGGSLLSLELKLKKTAPKTGSLTIKVTNKELKSPIANATVKVADASVVTDEAGVATFSQLAQGAIAIAVRAEGYKPAEEAASVMAGQAAEVAVGLTELKKRIPATITGLVRSTVGGKAIAAALEIPQAKIKTRANASGAFTFRLEGGTYTVNISAPNYLSQSKSVTVKDGDQAIFNVDLYPK